MNQIVTIEQGKKYLRDNFQEGVECPCCKQIVKLYRHSINSQVASALVKMATISVSEGKEYVHIINEVKPRSTMYSILRYWDLIQQAPHEKFEDDKKASGLWKVTRKGFDFVANRITVPKYVYIFNNRIYDPRAYNIDDKAQKQVTIMEALGKKFSYTELMGDVIIPRMDGSQTSFI